VNQREDHCETVEQRTQTVVMMFYIDRLSLKGYNEELSCFFTPVALYDILLLVT
jgi:hypothetical protein